MNEDLSQKMSEIIQTVNDKVLSAIIDKYDLSSNEFLLLNILHRQGPMMMSTLVKKNPASPGWVSITTKKFAKMGLVEKKRSEEDERVVMICLASKGTSLLEKIQEDLAFKIKGCFEGCTPVEKEIFISFLTRFSCQLQQII